MPKTKATKKAKTTKTTTKTVKKRGMTTEGDGGTHAPAPASASSSRGRGGGASSFAACTIVPRAFGDGKIGGPTRKSAKGGWTPEEVRARQFEICFEPTRPSF